MQWTAKRTLAKISDCPEKSLCLDKAQRLTSSAPQFKGPSASPPGMAAGDPSSASPEGGTSPMDCPTSSHNLRDDDARRDAEPSTA